MLTHFKVQMHDMRVLAGAVEAMHYLLQLMEMQRGERLPPDEVE